MKTSEFELRKQVTYSDDEGFVIKRMVIYEYFEDYLTAQRKFNDRKALIASHSLRTSPCEDCHVSTTMILKKRGSEGFDKLSTFDFDIRDSGIKGALSR